MPRSAHTRDIARAAVRAELAQTAFELFRRDGFDRVTVSELAAAAGVSRSTFLRYFGSKEEAALHVFDAHGGLTADALRARPAGEDDWTALRRALDTVIELYRADPAGALAITRLVQATPALCARNLEKQQCWRPELTRALADRTGAPPSATLALSVRVAAAMDCLNIALAHWSDSDGQRDLEELLDEAFAALTTGSRAPRK